MALKSSRAGCCSLERSRRLEQHWVRWFLRQLAAESLLSYLQLTQILRLLPAYGPNESTGLFGEKLTADFKNLIRPVFGQFNGCLSACNNTRKRKRFTESSSRASLFSAANDEQQQQQTITPRTPLGAHQSLRTAAGVAPAMNGPSMCGIQFSHSIQPGIRSATSSRYSGRPGAVCNFIRPVLSY